MTEEKKQKAIELAHKMGFIVSFVSDSEVFVTDGDERQKFEYEDFLSKFNNN